MRKRAVIKIYATVERLAYKLHQQIAAALELSFLEVKHGQLQNGETWRLMMVYSEFSGCVDYLPPTTTPAHEILGCHESFANRASIS